MKLSTISNYMTENLSKGSLVRKMFEKGISLKKEFGADAVYDFSLGNPDLPPPIEETAKGLDMLKSRLQEPGILGYMPNAGFAWAREKIAEWLSDQQQTKLTGSNIVLGCGAAGAMNAFFHSVLDPGDEVLVAAPYFMEYNFYVANHGGVIKKVACNEDFSLDIKAFDQAITSKTRVILINSPNNPSGSVYSEKNIKELAELLKAAIKKFGRIIYLVSDEPYRFLVYDGYTVPPILPLYEYAVVVSSFSKNYSLAGERVGYLAINSDIEGGDDLLSSIIFSSRVLGFVNPPVIGQYLIKYCLGASREAAIQTYTKRRNTLAEILRNANIEFTMPKGTFYMFPKAPGGDDLAFAEKLVENRILAVPGSGFSYPGYFRLSFAVEDKVIENSAEGFKKAVQQMK